MVMSKTTVESGVKPADAVTLVAAVIALVVAVVPAGAVIAGVVQPQYQLDLGIVILVVAGVDAVLWVVVRATSRGPSRLWPLWSAALIGLILGVILVLLAVSRTSVMIRTPIPGERIPVQTDVSGTSSNVDSEHEIWVFVQTEGETDMYPQAAASVQARWKLDTSPRHCW